MTSERVAGERLFSRGGCAGACCDGDDGAEGVGRGELPAGGAGGCALGVGAPGADGRGENSEQPESSAVIARACSTFSAEAVCAKAVRVKAVCVKVVGADAWVSRVSG